MRNLFHRGFPGGPQWRDGDKAAADDMWVRCGKCRELVYRREWETNQKVCPKCGHHERLSRAERIALLLDPDSFDELDAGLGAQDPLAFAPQGQVAYRDKLASEEQSTGAREASAYGRGTVDGLPIVLALLDLEFFAGSLSATSGEKLTRAFELALRERRPIVTCSASGGARQQEGMVALMQMAKIVAAVKALAREGVPYVSVLANPVLGGTTASYPVLADVIIAEPGAIVGFAGPRVVERATGEKLPPGTDTSEFQLRHGMIDMVVPRRDLRETVSRLLRLLVDAARLGESKERRERAARNGPAAVRELAETAAG
jgi:acetyl-CoA carboxylase carboxyl transferase subunit beta